MRKLLTCGILSLTFLCTSCGRGENSSVTDESDQVYSEQLRRYDRQLDKSDEQDRRLEALLTKWEEQAKRQDRILEEQERRLGIKPDK